MSDEFIKIERSRFRLRYDFEGPQTLPLSRKILELEPEDREDDPELAAKEGQNIPHCEDQAFKALAELIWELRAAEHYHNYYHSKIGGSSRVCGYVDFDEDEWDEESAKRELRLRIQRWLSACRCPGTIDEIIARTSLQERLKKLGEIQGPQWGTMDAYLANKALIEKEYEDLRGHVVWVRGLCFEEALARLDFLLTGKDKGNPGDANWNYPKHPEDCLTSPGNLIYLSDGGYSRIAVHQIEEDGVEMFSLRLTDESRDEVKEKWNEHMNLCYRAMIELAMNKWLEKALEEEDG